MTDKENETLITKIRRWQGQTRSALTDVRCAYGLLPQRDHRYSKTEARLKEADFKLQRQLDELDALIPMGSR